MSPMAEDFDDAGGLRALIAQTRLATTSGLYFLALFGALAVPDIAGALGSDNGRATGSKYKAWLRDWVPAQSSSVDATYGLRCSLVHQGSALPHGGHSPVMFTLPGGPQIHNLSMQAGSNEIGVISIEMFVDEVCRGAEEWLDAHLSSATVQRNIAKYARLPTQRTSTLGGRIPSRGLNTSGCVLCNTAPSNCKDFGRRTFAALAARRATKLLTRSATSVDHSPIGEYGCARARFPC